MLGTEHKWVYEINLSLKHTTITILNSITLFWSFAILFLVSFLLESSALFVYLKSMVTKMVVQESQNTKVGGYCIFTG